MLLLYHHHGLEFLINSKAVQDPSRFNKYKHHGQLTVELTQPKEKDPEDVSEVN